MHVHAFPGSCSTNVLTDFYYVPDPEGTKNKWGELPTLSRTNKEEFQRKFKLALETKTQEYVKGHGRAGLILAITNEKQNEDGVPDIFIECGWVPLIEGFNNPVHSSTCTLWAYWTRPSLMKALRLKGSSRKKVMTFLRAFKEGTDECDSKSLVAVAA